MSGAGKTTLLNELSDRGHETIDTDYDGWTSPDGDWDEPRMAALLAGRATVIVSGTVTNQGRFYDRFDHMSCSVRHSASCSTASRPGRPIRMGSQPSIERRSSATCARWSRCYGPAPPSNSTANVP